jgi:hypothetical protein
MSTIRPIYVSTPYQELWPGLTDQASADIRNFLWSEFRHCQPDLEMIWDLLSEQLDEEITRG